jgi:REP element-mobilizing transposase RayT
MSVKPDPLHFDTLYHIYNRGINRGNIFFEDRNYDYFLTQFFKHAAGYFDTFAYCLLPNHFHFLLRVRSEAEILACGASCSPSQKFGNFLNGYAKAINKTYDRSGSLFQQRFPRKPVLSDSYLSRLVTYIHHNPQRHGLINDFRDWPYSSYWELANPAGGPLAYDDVMSWYGDGDAAAGPAPFISAHDLERIDYSPTFDYSPVNA